MVSPSPAELDAAPSVAAMPLRMATRRSVRPTLSLLHSEPAHRWRRESVSRTDALRLCA